MKIVSRLGGSCTFQDAKESAQSSTVITHSVSREIAGCHLEAEVKALDDDLELKKPYSDVIWQS